MALLNLFDVTDTLIRLLTLNLAEFVGGTFAVVPQAPDKIPNTTETPTLSVYLYHAREDAHYKNAEPAGGTTANNPLALSLYYVVTAHRYSEPDQLPDLQAEQNLLGYALKTFHDFPVITDTTQVGADVVMTSLLGEDNRLQIVYRPVSPEDAMAFWNADDERLIRFSAFYEVRVVFMKHAQPTHMPGYVLSVGNYVLPIGVMSIIASESVVRFTPPGGEQVTLLASPARVALSGAAPPAGEAANNQLTLRGTRLGGGRLVLRSPLFPTPNNQITVLPGHNPLWSISVTASRLVAHVHGELERPDGVVQRVLPGIYGASIEVSSTYQLPGGLSKTIVTRSNEVPIAITPFITTDDGVGPGPPPVVVTLHVDGETKLDAAELADEISVVVANQVYKRITAGTVGLHEFKVTGPAELMIGAPFVETDAGIYPVRVIIRGTEAPPYWIEVDG